MRAIILSAGRGRRLLPLTADIPKCLLPVDGKRPILELQLEALARCGIPSATVMVGFGAERVEEFLARRPVQGIEVRTFYNPFFEMADNLATCWLARSEMTDDFVLLNGDTVIQAPLLRHVLLSSRGPVSVAIDRKAEYVEDDMKVTLRGDHLCAVGKTIPPANVDGESIGLIVFRGDGVEAFRAALDGAMRNPAALRRWYLAVVDAMAADTPVRAVSIEGMWWAEIDSPTDLVDARADLERQRRRPTVLPRIPLGGAALPHGMQ